MDDACPRVGPAVLRVRLHRAGQMNDPHNRQYFVIRADNVEELITCVENMMNTKTACWLPIGGVACAPRSDSRPGAVYLQAMRNWPQHTIGTPGIRGVERPAMAMDAANKGQRNAS
jgi:hypothetical protein